MCCNEKTGILNRNAASESLVLDEILREFEGVEGSLITILQKTQEKLGYISEDSIYRISAATGIKVSKIIGVATFYSQFRLSPVGENLIMLCKGTACHVNGADGIEEAITDYLGIKDGETTEDGIFTLNTAACLGCCSLAPVMMVKSSRGDETYGNLTKISVKEILERIKGGEAE